MGPEVELAREVVEELARTGLIIGETLGMLIEELEEGAFPGEENAKALLDMVAGSCMPVVSAAGEELCTDALALVRAVRDKFIADLCEAAELAASKHHRD